MKMSKIKTTVILLFLAVITVCIVFVPQFINGQSESLLLNKTSFWSYNGRESTQITSKQVAELYGKSDFFIGGNYPVVSGADANGEYDPQEIIESSKALFERVFENNEDVRAFLETAIGEDPPEYTRENVLTVIDGNPIVLNFISVCRKNAFEILEYVYEEKTQTLLYFSYYPFSELLSNKYDTALSLEETEKLLCRAGEDYYKNVLELKDGQFFSQTEEYETSAARQNLTEFGIVRNYADAIENDKSHF